MCERFSTHFFIMNDLLSCPHPHLKNIEDFFYQSLQDHDGFLFCFILGYRKEEKRESKSSPYFSYFFSSLSYTFLYYYYY